MKLKVFAIVTIILFSFYSCKKEYLPYVTFKNSNYKVIKSELIDVDLNTEYNLIIESGYKSTPPIYSIQKNNALEQVISNSNIVQESQGWNGKKGLNFKIVRVRLDFNSTNFNVGDQLTLFSRHSGISEFLVFRIK